MDETLLQRFREVSDGIEAAGELLKALGPERRRLIREMAAMTNPATGQPWRQKDLAETLEVPVGLVHQAIMWRHKKRERAAYYGRIAEGGGGWAKRYQEIALAASEEP